MPELSPASFGLILLAAGGSSRMGQPKQLLAIEGKPLLARMAETALQSKAWPIIVVLGHAAIELRPILAKLPLQLIENPEWMAGMGSSIRSGIQILDRFSSSIPGVVIALADQPNLTAENINLLALHCDDPKQIVAARYSDAVGAPVYFPRHYFPELRNLAVKAGAQSLLKMHAENLRALDFPALATDLDTPEDYRKFTSGEKP